MYSNFYHQLGVFLYYPKIEIKKLIIVKPQSFIHELAKLFLPPQFDDENKLGDKEYWQDLKDKGILSSALCEVIWQDDEIDCQYLIEVLKYFLLAVPINRDESYKQNPDADEYFVPCMIKPYKPCGAETMKYDVLDKAEPLHLVFNTNLVPPGYFCSPASRSFTTT